MNPQTNLALRALIEAALQFILFMVPVFIVFIFQRKKGNPSLSNWLGLYGLPPSGHGRPLTHPLLGPLAKTLVLALVIMLGPLYLLGHFKLIDSNLFATAGQAAMGLSPANIFAVLCKAWLQTGLTEEIFFRGFIGKMLVRKLGFKVGNSLQGLIFGLPHGLPLIIVTGNWLAGLVLIFCASAVGMLQMNLNEKHARGSILPSIVLHGIMNTLSFGSRLL